MVNPRCIGFLLFSALLAHVHGYFTLDGQPIFELDGNVESNGYTDWETIIDELPAPNFVTSSGAIHATGKSFQIGSRDTHAVKTWSWHHPGDFHGLVTGYVASFANESNTDFFFAVERHSSGGADFDLGLWLFQDHVRPAHGGKFHGTHNKHDLLVEVSVNNHDVGLATYEWSNGALHHIHSHFSSCDDSSKKIVAACAISNKNSVSSSSWGGISNSRASSFSSHHFIEGGFVLQSLFPSLAEMPTYYSIIIEHRDNGHADTGLKDFLDSSIHSSGLAFIVSCKNASGGCGTASGYEKISVENTGGGTLYNVKVVDASNNAVASWETMGPNEIYVVTVNPASPSYTASASSLESSSSSDLTVCTSDFASTQCGFAAPILTVYTSCSCSDLTAGGTMFGYAHMVKVINSGEVPIWNVQVSTAETGNIPLECPNPLCPGQQVIAYGYVASQEYPLVGFADVVTANYAGGVYTVETDPIRCDISACQLQPALTMTTVCVTDTFTSKQQINDTLCNRGNVAVSMSVRDSRGFAHFPDPIVVLAGACGYALSPFEPFIGTLMEGTIAANGTALLGHNTTVNAAQNFFCYMP